MKKICAFIFVLSYVVTTAVVHAATVEMDGKKLECTKDGLTLLTCMDGSQSIIVIPNARGYVAVTKKQQAVLLKNVTKVSDGGRVLYQANMSEAIEDTKNNRLISANAVVSALSSSDSPIAKKLVADAQNYIKNEGAMQSKVTVSLNGGKDNYQCIKGENKNPNPKKECAYFSCSGKDSAEKLLMFLPSPGSSFESPNILSLKSGQAKFINGDFQVKDNSTIPVANFPKVKTVDEYLASGADDTVLDPNLLIPSKYDESKSSYYYLKNFAENGFRDFSGDTNNCGGEGVTSLFSEKKKVAEDMQKSVAEAELIEYLKVIDGNVHSFYVDRKKGMGLGCLYQNKILDRGVVSQIDHLNEISVTKPITKYLSIDEVQSLFDEAKNMKDIPFGYKYDGCYARAHIMARRFEEKGIAAQKVWIKGDLFVPGTDIQWGYHVAPVVEVKTKEGKIEKYVIDPSLTSKAVPVDEWVATMGKNAKGPIMKTTYPFPGNGLDFQRTVVAISPTDVYAPSDMKDLQESDKMAMSKQVLREFSAVLAEQQSR